MREQSRRTAPLPLASRTPTPRVAIFALAVTGIALVMVGRTDPAVFESIRQSALETLAPIFETAAGPVRKARAWRRTMDERNQAFEDNQRLKAEIEALKADAAQARTNAALVERYQALLNIQLDPKIDYVTARIISDAGGPFMRAVVLNAGRDDGVEIGQGVVDSSGLVGRIVSLGKTSSRVLMLTDVKSRVPVLLRPSNIHALLVGDNSSEPTLEYVPNSATAGPGEQVLTSGRGGLLPPNIPIGAVMAPEGDGELVRVKLASDFSRLDYVRVMRFTVPIDIDEGGVTPDAAFPTTPVPVPVAGGATPAPAAELPKKSPAPTPSPAPSPSPTPTPTPQGAAPAPAPSTASTAPAADAAEPTEEGEDSMPSDVVTGPGTPLAPLPSGSAGRNE